MEEKEEVWCPRCVWFGIDCEVDPEEYAEPCESFALDPEYGCCDEDEVFI